MCTKTRVTSLGCGQPHRPVKPLRIDQLSPSRFVPFLRPREPKIPRDKADRLAGIAERTVFVAHLKKLRFGVPQRRQRELLQTLRFLRKLSR